MNYVEPKIGQKVKYINPSKHHWFIHVVEDEKKFLTLGSVYTIKDVIITSSCTYLTFEEIPFYDVERKMPFFNSMAFK